MKKLLLIVIAAAIVIRFAVPMLQAVELPGANVIASHAVSAHTISMSGE